MQRIRAFNAVITELKGGRRQLVDCQIPLLALFSSANGISDDAARSDDPDNAFM